MQAVVITANSRCDAAQGDGAFGVGASTSTTPSAPAYGSVGEKFDVLVSDLGMKTLPSVPDERAKAAQGVPNSDMPSLNDNSDSIIVELVFQPGEGHDKCNKAMAWAEEAEHIFDDLPATP
ncbi:hypothetical protein QAD02_009532 [Eretmocerus hayati]|uniref:Uncharacterized protein n=1 Tax=Eretmocerus hayati TaxID=131215 RepID=A0ACC2N9H9_9HYME|nr:hypothetical protein QAD02_009532 [Eretmocerus hayati]